MEANKGDGLGVDRTPKTGATGMRGKREKSCHVQTSLTMRCVAEMPRALPRIKMPPSLFPKGQMAWTCCVPPTGNTWYSATPGFLPRWWWAPSEFHCSGKD